MDEFLKRHKNVALHFSGGKDSMACLYLLRPYLDRLTVYWVNTGDAVPENVEVISKCREWIPNFCEVRSDVKAWREQHGNPSDLVPTYSGPLGRLMGFGTVKISDRLGCCFQNVMRPMYERMKSEGVTGIIRGQKLIDMPTVPAKSGDVQDGFEFYYPIETWTNPQVFAYLKEVGAPIHSCYELGTAGVDCMHCTGWWNENLVAYLKRHHPEVHAEVLRDVDKIKGAIKVHLKDLERVYA